MALAGYYLKHSDALLSGGGVTADELVLDLGEFPSEVRQAHQGLAARRTGGAGLDGIDEHPRPVQGLPESADESTRSTTSGR